MEIPTPKEFGFRSEQELLYDCQRIVKETLNKKQTIIPTHLHTKFEITPALEEWLGKYGWKIELEYATDERQGYDYWKLSPI